MFIVSIMYRFCCEHCAVREDTWIPRHVFGPFPTAEQAQSFLWGLGFRYPNDPFCRNEKIPGVGELWHGFDAERHWMAAAIRECHEPKEAEAQGFAIRLTDRSLA